MWNNIRRLILVGLLGLSLPVLADNPVVQLQESFSSVTTGTVVLVRSTGASQWQIRFTAISTPATCTVKLEQSEDNSSWSDLIAASTCTSSGISVVTIGHPTYVRVNVTALTGGSVEITFFGFIAALPVAGGTPDGSTAVGNPNLVDNSGTLDRDGAVGTTGVPAHGLINAAVSLHNQAGAARPVNVFPWMWNGTTWDLPQNNIEVTLLASAARTANTDSTDQVNYNAKGVMIILDITVDAVSVGLTPSILMKDPVSGKDVTIWTAALAATGVGTDIYLIYPGVLAADFNGSEAVSIALPRTWVLRITTADADEATYSVGASYIN